MIIVKHATELQHGLSAYDGGLVHGTPDLRHNIYLFEAGSKNEAHWMTIEPTPNGKCMLDLTPMAESNGDGYQYRLPCKVQALKDVLDGRLRHLHNGDTFASFERIGDTVQIAFHRADPIRVTISLKDLEEYVNSIEAEPSPSAGVLEVWLTTCTLGTRIKAESHRSESARPIILPIPQTLLVEMAQTQRGIQPTFDKK